MTIARRFRVLLPLLIAAASGCAPLLRAGPLASDESLASEIDAIFNDPAFDPAHWGVLFRSLDTGETIYERNSEKLFLPASNMKLLTGAAALETLGPAYRFRTTIALGGPMRDGAIEGPLVVIGTGDPTFSERFHEDPREVFAAWADSLRAQGIERIEGGIVAVDTAFSDPHLGRGWMWDDLDSSSSAAFGALQFNEDVVHLEIFPSATVLEPAVVVLSPATQYVRIINDTRTMPAGSVTALDVTRDEASAAITIRGEIAADEQAVRRTIAVRNPPLYTASIIRETLRANGIAVEGPAIHYSAIGLDDPALSDAFTLFYSWSPPLGEILAGMLKPSQNQIAETLLRTVGREVGGEGSANGGVAVVDSLFAAWNFEHRDMRMVDGSGLSRYDHLSPALITELLTHMDQSPHRDLWLEALPISGRDGTLEERMLTPPLLEQVHAKTGSLSGVRALSGYLTTTSGERIVFSTIVNANRLGSSAADRLVEAALELIALER